HPLPRSWPPVQKPPASPLSFVFLYLVCRLSFLLPARLPVTCISFGSTCSSSWRFSRCRSATLWQSFRTTSNACSPIRRSRTLDMRLWVLSPPEPLPIRRNEILLSLPLSFIC